MSKPPVLSLIPKGSPDHPRFILANQHQECWTGRDWSTDENDGLLFANMRDVARVTNELLSEATKNKRSFKFVAPVEVEVRADESPDLTALMVWLMKAARLSVDYKVPGLADAVTLLSIDWTELREAGE